MNENILQAVAVAYQLECVALDDDESHNESQLDTLGGILREELGDDFNELLAVYAVGSHADSEDMLRLARDDFDQWRRIATGAPQELLPQLFDLQAAIGNDAMSTPQELAGALRKLADELEQLERLEIGLEGFQRDANGNRVISWDFSA